MSDGIDMTDVAAALSAAILHLGPDAFEVDGNGKPTGYSDAAVEFGRAYFENLVAK